MSRFDRLVRGKSVRAWFDNLSSADPSERRKAIGVLGQLDPTLYPQVAARLLPLSGDPQVGPAAVRALTRLALHGPMEAVLVRALGNPDPDVRRGIARVLGVSGRG